MNRFGKKIIAGICCLTLILGMAACGTKTQGEDVSVTPDATVTEAVTGEPEATQAPQETDAPKVTEQPEEEEDWDWWAVVTPEPTKVPVNPVEGKIMEAAEKLGFSFGTVVSAYTSEDLNYMMMLMEEFNSVTAANEMKAYSMLNQRVSQSNTDGMPALDFTQADAIVSLAEVLGLGVRGHVLVWDAYMSDWFFREGYTNDGAYVDEATMKKRLQFYIETVITHFETEFPGVVYCWDVVNEAVGDDEESYDDSDGRHIRTTRNGGENQFYNIIGDDYVEFSFLCAKNTVEKLQKADPEVNIKLFYNDYNEFYEEKRDAICELVKSINSYAVGSDGKYRKLCDGVGMQSYIGGYGEQTGCMKESDIKAIRKAILMYHELGVEVHITEMAVRNYDGDKEAEHAEFYGKLFDMLVELNAKEPVITNITIWGITDAPEMPEYDYSYRQNSPYCGLFDAECEKKGAYYKVLEAMQKAE